MIDLTVAQIADIVGGRLTDISPAEAAADAGSPARWSSTPARSPPAGCSWRCPAPAPTATTSPPPRWLPARSRCWPPVRSACRRSWCPGRAADSRRRPRRGARARHRRVRCRGAGRAGQTGRRGGRRPGGRRAAHRRHHRVVGQDLDQGPHRRGAAAAGRGGGPARVVQQRTRPPLDGAAGHPRTPTSWCWRCRRGTPATSPRWRAIAPPSIAVVLNVGTAHLGEFGSREVIATTKAELVQAVPASGVVVLNADDPVVAAMAAQTVGAGGHRRARARAPTCAPRTSNSTSWPGRGSPWCAAAAGWPVALAVHGEHQVGNALQRGGGRPGMRRHPRNRWPTRWPGPRRRRGTGWRCAPAPTG